MSTTPLVQGTPDSVVRLLELIQNIGFGRIENLVIRSGQPVLNPPPRIVRERLLGTRDQPPSPSRKDYATRDQVRELLVELNAIDNGVIASLEIRHGLPFKLTIADPPTSEEMRR